MFSLKAFCKVAGVRVDARLTRWFGAAKNRSLCSRLLCFPRSARLCIENENYTHRRTMRTNIVIDDQLMAEALKASGCETKKEAVEQGLKLLVQLSKQQEIRKLRGKVKWEGDLNEMRSAG